jgi:hypothetical protein
MNKPMLADKKADALLRRTVARGQRFELVAGSHAEI